MTNKIEYQQCKYYADAKDFVWCPVGNRGVIMEPASHCYKCPRYKDKNAANNPIEPTAINQGTYNFGEHKVQLFTRRLI